ncbi:MAG: hypothetical protein ABIQ98_06830 [Sphingomicrobium sp.]
MIVALGLLLVTAELAVATLDDARHALAAGRIEQARLIVDRAVAKGTAGRSVDALIADIAFQSGHDSDAATRYAKLTAADPTNALFAERAGIAALRSGDSAAATRLLTSASRFPETSWRVWNALGVVGDRARNWAEADAAYARALAVAPNEAAIANNRGWSQMLRGHWHEADKLLERAVALSPTNPRIRDNLELVRSAINQDLPARLARESDENWAARLNDAGVAAMLLHDRSRAVAAFSRAIAARGSWYQRAANNLTAAEATP